MNKPHEQNKKMMNQKRSKTSIVQISEVKKKSKLFQLKILEVKYKAAYFDLQRSKHGSTCWFALQRQNRLLRRERSLSERIYCERPSPVPQYQGQHHQKEHTTKGRSLSVTMTSHQQSIIVVRTQEAKRPCQAERRPNNWSSQQPMAITIRW